MGRLLLGLRIDPPARLTPSARHNNTAPTVAPSCFLRRGAERWDGGEQLLRRGVDCEQLRCRQAGVCPQTHAAATTAAQHHRKSPRVGTINDSADPENDKDLVDPHLVRNIRIYSARQIQTNWRQCQSRNHYLETVSRTTTLLKKSVRQWLRNAHQGRECVVIQTAVRRWLAVLDYQRRQEAVSRIRRVLTNWSRAPALERVEACVRLQAAARAILVQHHARQRARAATTLQTAWKHRLRTTRALVQPLRPPMRETGRPTTRKTTTRPNSRPLVTKNNYNNNNTRKF